MQEGPLLGLDFGERRIGVALSDSERLIASGLTTLDRRKQPDYLQSLEEIIRQKKVQAIVGSKLPIVFNPLPIDDPKQRCPNINKAKELLKSWEPKVQLREGLEKTIQFFRTRNK